MRTKITLLLLAGLLPVFSASAQLVDCRPQMCMIDYNAHDDTAPNADMTAIKSVKPDILIDNTPGGLWGGHCVASEYTPLGIKVFTYITGGYEGTTRHPDTSGLDGNLVRINLIAADGATGVFLDEVSSFPDITAKTYLSRIYDTCQARGIKLIFNTGVYSFDPWLMAHCDYIMTDEHYNGVRSLSTSESPYADRILVVAQGITDATTAATISTGARANGFGYTYACNEYINLPAWLSAYNTGMTHEPATPVITYIGTTLNSDAVYGNQWYNTAGPIPGATNQYFTPTSTGSHYSIVTLAGCTSDTSNVIYIPPTTGVNDVKRELVQITPNPAADYLSVTTDYLPAELRIYCIDGRLRKSVTLLKNSSRVDISEVPDGMYLLSVVDEQHEAITRIMIKR